MTAFASVSQHPPVSHPIGEYGRVERMRRGEKLVKKRPTEVAACKHLLAPDDPDFIPPAEKPSKLYCCRCKDRKPHEAFGKDERNINRWQRKTECLQCCAKIAKEARLKRRQARKNAAHSGV